MTDLPPPTAPGLPSEPPAGPAISMPPPPKKPLVRRWWFWLLVVLGVLFVISALTSGGGGDSASSDEGSDASAAAQPLDPTSLTGTTLFDALERLRAAGIPDESINGVGSITMASWEESVYDSSRFTVDNFGDEDFLRSQTVCGVRVDSVSAGDPLIVLWTESSCEEGTARIEALQAKAASASPTPLAQESTAPSASPTNEPDPLAYFIVSARGDIRDMAKDLDDMAVALDEGGIFRLMGNSLELSFNIGQLESLTPPEEIATAWNKALANLSRQSDALSDKISTDASTRQIASGISAVVKALNNLSKVVDRVDQ